MNDESMVKSVCMDADDIERAVTRMAHQILEANEEIEGVKVPLGKLDISFYRDDFATHMSPEVHSTDIPFSIDGMTIVLVDDVLYTGRTIRAALDALMDIGRPAAVELAVLVDRGHRELPIDPEYVGKNVPTARDEQIQVLTPQYDGTWGIRLLKPVIVGQ